MLIKFQTEAYPFFEQTYVLEGKEYVFAFRYNQREDRWYFSVVLPDGTSLVEGVKVVCKVSLLRRVADVRLPPGMLVAFPNGNDTSAPGFDELGIDRRVTLTYTTSDELEDDA